VAAIEAVPYIDAANHIWWVRLQEIR